MDRSIFWHIAYPDTEELVKEWLQPLPNKFKLMSQSQKSFMFMIPMKNLIHDTSYLLFETSLPFDKKIQFSNLLKQSHPFLQHLLSEIFLNQKSITIYVPLEKVEQVQWIENVFKNETEFIIRNGLIWNTNCKICNCTSRAHLLLSK